MYTLASSFRRWLDRWDIPLGLWKLRFQLFYISYFFLCIFQNKYHLYYYLIYFAVYHCFIYHQRFIKGSFEKNLSQTPFLITLWLCSFFFSFFSPIMEFKVHGWSNHKKMIGFVWQMKNLDRYIVDCVV